MDNFLWKIENEDGNSLDGFRTEQEAKAMIPAMRQDKKWEAKSYRVTTPEDYEDKILT